MKKFYAFNVYNELNFLFSIINKDNSNLHKHNIEVSKIAKILLENYDKKLPIDNFSKRVLNKLGVDSVALAYRFHDIGKTYISQEILDLDRKLTPDEFEVVKNHVSIGVHIVKELFKSRKNMDTFKQALYATIINIIANHHENIDGKGYPNNKNGEQISLLGKVARVADVISALMTKRSYKDAWNEKDVLSYINQNKGILFDENVVNIANQHWKSIVSLFNKNQFESIVLSRVQKAM